MASDDELLLDTLIERVVERAADRLVAVLSERLPHGGNGSSSASAPDVSHGRWRNTQAAADHLGVKRNTLEIWRVYGRGPKFSKIHGGRVRYDVRDLDAWLKAGERRHTDARAPSPKAGGRGS